MPAHDATALITELSARGVTTGATEGQARAATDKAWAQLAVYCGLPEAAPLPDGIFYGWMVLTAVLLLNAKGGAKDGKDGE